jgi:DNA-binding NarL/FixJ family response regulator
VLVFPVACDPSYVNELLKAGADGCATAGNNEELGSIIRDVFSGLVYVSEEVYLNNTSAPSSGRSSRDAEPSACNPLGVSVV